MKELFGSWQQSFQMLFNWRVEVLQRSPGSIIEIDIKPTPTRQSLALVEATDLSIQMASVVAEAKMASADDMEIPEPPRASTKSKEVKEIGLGLNDPSKMVKIRAHLDPK